MGPLSPAQLASGELPLFAMTARTTKLTWLMDPLIVFFSLAKSPLQGAGCPSHSMDHQAVASHFASLLPSRQTFSLIFLLFQHAPPDKRGGYLSATRSTVYVDV